MTSAQRLYLDRLWWTLGVDPRSDVAQVIELRVTVAATQDIVNGFAELKKQYDAPALTKPVRRGA